MKFGNKRLQIIFHLSSRRVKVGTLYDAFDVLCLNGPLAPSFSAMVGALRPPFYWWSHPQIPFTFDGKTQKT